MPNRYDVVIIGGGLAGLTSAIHLSRSGFLVLVIESHPYPRHKVCGEYISNEVLPYLQSLEFNPFDHGAQKISRFQLSATSGKLIETRLPLGGFGISRYCMDDQLAQLAIQSGATIMHDKVLHVSYNQNQFTTTVSTSQSFESTFVVGAFGKRSNLDNLLNRTFIQNKSPFLAVKAHYTGDFPSDLVAIHNFNGGYCGVSKVENDKINICYIADYQSFQKFKNLDAFQSNVLHKNRHLKELFERLQPDFEKPLSISQISFAQKKCVDQHILMCGDSAGMIHPLCGNGMSMAIHSAKILSECLISFLNDAAISRQELETSYARMWEKEFKSRLKTGKALSKLFEFDHFSEFMIFGLKIAPALLPKIIKHTHGKPIEI